MVPGFIESYLRLTEYACKCGWHEANGGNLSYKLSDDDLHALDEWISQNHAASDERNAVPSHGWHQLANPVPELADICFLVSGSGAHLRNLAYDWEANAGVIELDEAGVSWRVLCGLESGARPSSELETHLAIYAQAAQELSDDVRVVYHAHASQTIALSCVLEPSPREWSRVLWKCMTEGIIVFPEGIGSLPWMVPGSPELARETAAMMREFRACAWARHGLIVRAPGFDEALGLVETVEKCAGIYLQARAACGGSEPMHLVSDEELRAVCDRYDLQPNESFLD